jgi:hypothetical protein
MEYIYYPYGWKLKSSNNSYAGAGVYKTSRSTKLDSQNSLESHIYNISNCSNKILQYKKNNFNFNFIIQNI